ncbi:hypothetical protein [Marinilabilia salmonicolor]|uniref:hypothetical protein n=2 Tax=Marinilabilia salmonicolor TaxID=989 RepID=UPI00031671DE|nr:hypothetical protein [Marinilabilia salmonicolor]
MITRFYTFLISITLLFSCNISQDKSRGIMVKKDIPENILNRLIELELINSSDTVLGLFYHTANEPNNISEDYTFFTSNKLLRYFQFGEKDAKIYVAPFNKTLSIKREIDSVYNRIEINTLIFDTILFNKYEQRDDIFYDNTNFYCNYGTQFSKQETFYQLLLETWKNNNEYLSLKEINDKYFDKNGERKATPDKIFEREKIQSIKDRLKELSIDVIDEEDYLVINYNKSIIRISYYFYSKEFTVLKLIVEPFPTDDFEMTGIAAAYPTHKLKEKVFPYSERGITYKEVSLSKEKSENEIIEKYF